MDSNQEPPILIREPMVDGIFYPAEQSELIATIQGLLLGSTILPGNAKLIVSPHGSFEFSGTIMADAYKTISGSNPQRLIIIGSCFHKQNPGIFLPESTIFRTPLDDSRTDMTFIAGLHETSTLITCNDIPHLQEHSIEIQLPFIQYLFPGIPIVPILLGNSSEIVFRALISGLSLVLNEQPANTLIIVSSNLSAMLDRNQAHRESEQILDLILTGKSTELMAAASHNEISGENAAALAVAAFFSHDGDMNIVARGSSLSVHYDPTNVVEYVALALA